MKKKEEELLTSKEVMEILRISKSTLLRYEKVGKIPFIRIGRMKRYKKKDIQKIIEQGL